MIKKTDGIKKKLMASKKNRWLQKELLA